MAYRTTHRIAQLLTLYMQKRWEQITWGGFNHSLNGNNTWEGKSLLLAPLPSNELSRSRTYAPPMEDTWNFTEDYDEEVQTAGLATVFGLTSDFLLPQVLFDVLQVKGTGFLCLTLSTRKGAGAGQITLTRIAASLMRYSQTALIDTVFNKTWSPNWANNSTTETIRAFLLELPDLNFTLNLEQRLALRVFIFGDWNASAVARLYFTRGKTESYVQIPVQET